MVMQKISWRIGGELSEFVLPLSSMPDDQRCPACGIFWYADHECVGDLWFVEGMAS